MARNHVKPVHDYTFRLIDGAWREVSDYEYLLADFLAEYQLYFDERLQFARVYDYERGVCIWYRAYNQAKITATLWPITNL